MVESFSVEFLYLKMAFLSFGPGRTGAEPLQKLYCVFGFCQIYGSFLNKGVLFDYFNVLFAYMEGVVLF